MGVEIGDMAAADGRVGEVVDLLDGRAVIRPFPIAEQADWPGKPECFVAQDELRILKKHFAWPCSSNRENDQWRERLSKIAERSARQHHERAAAINRDWYELHREPSR